MAQNRKSERLKLNADKTQLIWLGTRQQLTKLTVTQLRLTSSVVEFDSTVTDLGVVLDNQLSICRRRWQLYADPASTSYV